MFSGLSKQGELNVDVLDHDATRKLAKWFDDRWSDRWCIDITDELIEVIEESRAREEPLEPYMMSGWMACNSYLKATGLIPTVLSGGSTPMLQRRFPSSVRPRCFPQP